MFTFQTDAQRSVYTRCVACSADCKQSYRLQRTMALLRAMDVPGASKFMEDRQGRGVATVNWRETGTPARASSLVGSLGAVTIRFLVALMIFLIQDNPRTTASVIKTSKVTYSAVPNDVLPLPVFLPTSNNITVSPGDRAILRCRVDNLGTKTVTWKKYNQVHPLTIGLFQFAPDARISVDFSQRYNEWSLIIQDVVPMDEGIYQCQISTKNELDTYDVALNVRNILVSGTEYVERGGTIQLTCNATGKPEPPHDVEWYKSPSTPIRSDARHGVIITKKIETKMLVSMLVISNSKQADEGNYVCRTSGASGFESAKITVRILNGTKSDRITGSRGVGVRISRTSLAFLFLTFIIYSGFCNG